jgi:hypothetical protein
MTEPRAQFTVIESRGCILVEDLDQGVSVTNDAEAVIASLARRGFDLASRPVIYRDTTGRWDGLRVRRGAFAGFVTLGGTLSEAIFTAKGLFEPEEG